MVVDPVVLCCEGRRAESSRAGRWKVGLDVNDRLLMGFEAVMGVGDITSVVFAVVCLIRLV